MGEGLSFETLASLRNWRRCRFWMKITMLNRLKSVCWRCCCYAM